MEVARHSKRVRVLTPLTIVVAILGIGVPTAGATTPGPALLTGVQAQDMGTFDRVTFTFQSGGNLPAVASAAYVQPPVLADASGLPIAVAGNAVIRIAMSNASAVDQSVNPPVTTYTGPTRIEAGLSNVVEVVQVGDFESVLSWAIGIRSAPVTAQAQLLTDGGVIRVVVDVPHAAPAVSVNPSFTG
jgi:hypothetical protein